MWIGPSRSMMAPFGIVLRLALVLLDQAHAFDEDLLLLRQDLQDLARGPAWFPEIT